MKNEGFSYKPYRSTLFTIAALLLCLLVIEGWLYHIKPFTEQQETEYKSSLSQASRAFTNRHDQLLEYSQQLTSQLETQLQNNADRQTLYQYLQQFPFFWGATLYQGTRPVVWSGFSFSSYPADLLPESAADTPYIDVIKQNNVLSFLCSTKFAVEDSSGDTEYELLTTARIEQENALPIGQSHEFNLINYNSESLTYPADYIFFEAAPDSMLEFSILSTASHDSVGLAYISNNTTSGAAKQWEDRAFFWRSLFVIISYMAVVILVYIKIGRKKSWFSLLLQLILIAGTWGFFYYMEIPGRWIDEVLLDDSTSNKNLIFLAKNSLFIFWGAETLSRFLRQKKPSDSGDNFLRTMFVTGIYGLLSSLVLTGVISVSYYLLIDIRFSLFDLQIFPDALTFILFLSLSLLLFAVGLVLTSTGEYLLKREEEPYKLVLIIAVTSFIIGLVFLQLYMPPALSLNWATWTCMLFFIFILVIATVRTRFAGYVSFGTIIRTVTIGSFLLSVFSYPILKQANFVRIEEQMLNEAQTFQNRQDTTAQNITRNILTDLEQELSGITSQDLNNRMPYVQSTFNQTIEENLLPQMQIYSYNLQLVKPSGALIADYSTDLNAPNWTTIFDIDDLAAATDIERITKANNRPIVQMPQLQNAGDYETFYRGWIPIFSPDSDEQIAWILCSVYREQPELDKPIRAVLASINNTNWNNAMLLLEYVNGKLVRSNRNGLIGHFPRYNKLRTAEIAALSADSVIYYSSYEPQETYRNLLIRTSGSNVIKATTQYPNTRNELFAFFRLSFSLLLTGLLIVPVYLGITVGQSAFDESHQRFEHRIVDRLLLASLLFLGLLVGTTHYAIKTQNKEIVRQNLYEKLQKLATATKDDPNFSNNIQNSSSFSMQDVVAPFDVDASFYNNTVLQQSTTPQIYQQNLLPSVLPFDIFHELYLQQKSQATGNVELASQNLLIGYQTLLSAENTPIATVSIPTFLESPKYDQQLLETTSYLIVFYIFTFGIFILATTMIARQITEPLRSIQKGLNKISEGNLNMKIPVKSDDEIGTLAAAYNEMVERLKQVRKELAIAERQAAWKEMAQQVAHEIKNPLTPMKLNVQHLERQLGNGTQDLEQLTRNIKKFTRNLSEQIQTLNSIASDFSKFSKPIDQEFTKVDINQITHSVANLYKHDEKTIIQTELTQYPIYVNGVDDELRRVVINLVKNAFEALPPDDGQIILKSYIKKSSAFLEIEDNGEGISEEDRSKIFVPNFSTKSSGTGLGLAICKKIVEAHEGSISFASIEGQGTTFIVKLPLWNR